MRRDETAARAPGAGEQLHRTEFVSAPGPAGFLLYSRRNCRLCDEMLAALQTQLGTGIPVTVVEVDGDPALDARYGRDVPVLMFGQTEVCRHRHEAEKVAAFVARSR